MITETNSILVMCAYLVLEHKWHPVEALRLFEGIATVKYVKDPLATYHLEVIDYLEALEFASTKGWYDYKKFDSSGYLHYDSFNNGDINWIIPNMMLAFSGPSDEPTSRLTLRSQGTDPVQSVPSDTPKAPGVWCQHDHSPE